MTDRKMTEREMTERETRVTGVGLGLRWEFIDELRATLPALPFLEISPENYVGRGGRYPALLGQLRERYPMLSHGLMLSLGGRDPFDAVALRALRGFLDEIEAPWHSDHLCFSTVDGAVLHDLLPVPFLEPEIGRIADRIRRVQDALGRPMAVENVSYYMHPGAAEMGEAEFVARVCEEADCLLMLDVNNAYVNARNFGHDVRAWLRTVPLDRVVQMHVAGHDWFSEGDFELTSGPGPGRLIVDTHGADVVPDVLTLLEEVVAQTGPVPVVLERDQSIPALPALLEELGRVRTAYDLGLAAHGRRTEPRRARGAADPREAAR